MSRCTSAVVPATNAVSAPIVPITASTCGLAANSGFNRTTRYTPAVTIVAAWINADTGVGPAIASGSQVNSGICADLPVQPPNKHSAASASIVDFDGSDATCRTA